MDTLYNFRTDRRGQFTIEELYYYDSATFSFQARNKKGRIFGETELLLRQRPAIPLLNKSRVVRHDTIPLTHPLNFFAPKKDTVEVVKVDENISSTAYSNTYADYVLTSDDLENMPSGLSIINVLIGRIPGLRLSSDGGSMSFGGNKFGSNEKMEPLFVVDGIPVFSQMPSQQRQSETAQQIQTQQDQPIKAPTGNVEEAQAMRQNQNPPMKEPQPVQDIGVGGALGMINHITVSSVSRVEVMTRMDPRYGSMGMNGVISIYTKKVQGKRSVVKPFDVYTVPGFSKPLKFEQAKVYSGNSVADYVPTWYWNPSVEISAKKFSQIKFSALPKGVMFKVTVAGVTNSGEPVTGSFLLNSGGTKSLSASLDQRQK
jgi:hypothetical protein